jgi:squalene-associated FAD-dependent desaturase
MRVAVIGAGWAGLAAAVRATESGHRVTLYDTAATPGGRARTVEHRGLALDNGQHILIGAYLRTLDLMRTVGVETDRVLARMPLALVDPAGRGLRLAPGHPVFAFVRGVASNAAWPAWDRMRFIVQAAAWGLNGFRCEPDRPVASWCGSLPASIRRDLVEPLCVAALNTPAEAASAGVFLRVLRDGLFSGTGSADLLLPRRPLGALLPEAAVGWLARHAASVRLAMRVHALQHEAGQWMVDGEGFEAVVLATTANEAARLTAPHAPDWSARAARFSYEPIVTAWFEAPGLHLPFPMVTLRDGPAQFAFDLGRLHGSPGRFSLVVSGAAAWVEAGPAALEQALRAQLAGELRSALPRGPESARLLAVLTDKRATFRCTPDLERPAPRILPRLLAAGDYVAGPYPATLEGAVRAGEGAARQLGDAAQGH